MRVLLSGGRADSCVRGSPLLFDSLIKHGHFIEFWRHSRVHRRYNRASLKKTILLYLLAPMLPISFQRSLLLMLANRDVRRDPTYDLPTWMSESFRQSLATLNSQLCQRQARSIRFSSPARQSEYSLLYPPDEFLNPGHHPVQVVYPFADRRLHEFLLAVPPEEKYKASWEPSPPSTSFYGASKRLVRTAMDGIVPESIRTRTSKTVFDVLVSRAADAEWAYYESRFVGDGHSRVAQRGYIDRDKFWRRLVSLRERYSGHDLLYVRDMIWLERWLATFELPEPTKSK